MKLKPKTAHVIKPAGTMERLFRCERCGKLFMKVHCVPLLPVKCPYCGSFKTGEDQKVRY